MCERLAFDSSEIAGVISRAIQVCAPKVLKRLPFQIERIGFSSAKEQSLLNFGVWDPEGTPPPPPLPNESSPLGLNSFHPINPVESNA